MSLIKVNGLNDMSMAVGRLDRADFRDVVINDEVQERVRGMWNVNQNELAAIVSPHYKIVQHNDVLQAVTETLGRLNLNVTGFVHNWHNKVKLDLVFQDKDKIIKDDADGIRLGIRVINSYDKTSSFRLEMLAFRLVCANGMSLGSVMHREITFHTGVEKPLEVVAGITEKFTKDAINRSELLQRIVNHAIGDSLEWEVLDKIMSKLFKKKKHIEKIKERLPVEKKELTRWDVYNAVTNYLSHDEHLTPHVITWMEKAAEVMLEKNTEQLLELAATSIQY